MIFAMAMGLNVAVQAQDEEKGSSISLSVLVEDLPQPFPEMAKTQLTNKLNGLITKNGVASLDYLNRFIITVMATPQTKDIVPGPPTQISQDLEMTFYIADYYDQKVFATTTIQTKGVGTNDNRSYMDAIKRINLDSPVLSKFVTEGKKKIINYYDKQAETLIKEARALIQKKEYEAAFFKLGSIPSECKRYDEAIKLGNETYQKYVDHLCEVNLAKAKTTWMSQQNADGAAAVSEYLSQIYPDAKCYKDAQSLYKEVKGKVMDDWKFEMKQYQDGADLNKQKVKAWGEVGVAYGKGQQPSTTNLNWLH